MSKKIRLGVLFGGRSCEHEVSVSSARAVLEAIDPARYEVTMIGISKDGQWLMAGDAPQVLESGADGEGRLPAVSSSQRDGSAQRSAREVSHSGTEGSTRDDECPVLESLSADSTGESRM